MNSEEPISKPDLYIIARVIKILKEQNKLKRKCDCHEETTKRELSGFSKDLKKIVALLFI